MLIYHSGVVVYDVGNKTDLSSTIKYLFMKIWMVIRINSNSIMFRYYTN